MYQLEVLIIYGTGIADVSNYWATQTVGTCTNCRR